MAQPMRESPQALEAFTIYRDMGPDRSLDSVGKRLGKSAALMERWSAAHSWVARAATHDRAIADAAAERDKAARLADIDKRRQDRLKVAAAARGKGAGGLSTLAPESIADVVRLFDYADRTERLEMGEATDRTEVSGKDGGPITHRHTVDLSGASDEELVILERIAARLRGGSAGPGDDSG